MAATFFQASSPNGPYRSTVLGASFMSGISGAAFGLYHESLLDSAWMLAATGASASLAVVLTWKAVAMRRPAATAAAVTAARKALDTLPAWTRPLLLLPSPKRLQTPRADNTFDEKLEQQSSLHFAQRIPVDAERERLRRKGLTDQQITDIFIARETNVHGGKSFGSGVATGLLNNLEAIVTHAKSLLPSFKADLEIMFDSKAVKANRASSAVALALKLCALGALGYFLWIEAIELRARAYKARADACIAEQQNLINHSTIYDILNGKIDREDECSLH
jgi:hypothetical protein